MPPSDAKPRVRFAPSPTGMLHLGNARTALFDWLFARHYGGTCLLRIEDTDEARDHPEWVDLIYRSLEWLGLDWDGVPTFQSARFDQHRATAQKLFQDGHAYYCDCTNEDVDRRREERGEKTPGYDSFCATRELEQAPGRLLRFRVPDEGMLTRNDLIRGTTELDLGTVEDFGIVRGNGVPLYVFANAIDDIEDEITHIVRGEDHLANVPKQVLIRRALGLGEPVWAHVPFIVNAQRKKLSKRRDKLALEAYRDEGYLPEAMRNYLATLGWSPGEQEIVPLERMIETFDLADVVSSPAMFDEKKLNAFNAHYIRELPEATFVSRALPWLESTHAPWPPEAFDFEKFNRMANEVQTRVQTLAEVPAMVDFIFLDEPVVDDVSWTKAMKEPAASILARALDVYGNCEWSAAVLKEVTDSLASEFDLQRGKAQAPIRVAITGRSIGPPLFESLEVLGRQAVLDRLRAALARMG